MKIAIILSVAVVVWAQAPSFESISALQSDGRVVLTVKNVGNYPMNAVIVTCKNVDNRGTLRSEGQHWQDTALHPWMWKPLDPDASRTFECASNPGLQVEAGVRAVVFRNGKTEGSPEWVQRLFGRRTAARESLDQVLSKLAEAKSTGQSLPVLLGEIDALKNAEINRRGGIKILLDNGELYGIQDVFDGLSLQLTRQQHDPADKLADRIERIRKQYRSWRRSLESAMSQNPLDMD